MKTLLQILVFVMGTVTAVRADINVVLDNPNQLGLPGVTLQFFGTITNTGAETVFLNSDDINFTGASGFSITDPFLFNVPVSLVGGMTSGDIELFDVSLSNPFTDPPGLYGGSYTLTGGADGGAQDTLATTDFSVTAAAPEPGYWQILLLAISGLLFGIRFRQRPTFPREKRALSKN